MKSRVFNTVNWKRYLVPNQSPRVDRFLEENGKDVYQQVTDMVLEAIKDKKDKLVVVVHPHAGNAIVISKDEYNEFLKIANDWFLKTEDYRMCGKIKSYKELYTKKKVTKLPEKKLI
jgi:PHD/YefM family antitoxin component YafN of YafNO toxin-antitoxin module